MEERKYNIRIAVGATNVDPNEMILFRNGEKDFNPHFREKLSGYMMLFNDVFSDLFNDNLGADGWGIWFKQFVMETNSFICDIYLNDVNKFQLVKSLIEQQMPKEIKIHDCYFQGSEADYFATLPK